jgi:hypothetical protein
MVTGPNVGPRLQIQLTKIFKIILDINQLANLVLLQCCFTACSRWCKSSIALRQILLIQESLDGL